MATTGPDRKVKFKERECMAETFLLEFLPATREPPVRSRALRSVNAIKWYARAYNLGGTTDAESFRPFVRGGSLFFCSSISKNEETDLWNGPD